MQRSFLGKGWGFPVVFQKSPEAGVVMVREIEDIEQSLTILLHTRPGERVLRPDFGGNLEELLFEPANTGLFTYVEDLISKAVLYYEPRVNLEKVSILTDAVIEGRLMVHIQVTVRSTNSRFNYVYDFYKREASFQPA